MNGVSDVCLHYTASSFCYNNRKVPFSIPFCKSQHEGHIILLEDKCNVLQITNKLHSRTTTSIQQLLFQVNLSQFFFLH